MGLQLDDLCTAVGVYRSTGELVECNLALAQWFDGDEIRLDTVFKDMDAAGLAQRTQRGSHVARGSAKDSHGGTFPVELLLRPHRIGPDESGFLLEGHDATRTVQQEVMLQTFSSLVQDHERRLRQSLAHVQRLLDSLPQAVFSVGEDLRVEPPASAHAARLFGRDIGGDSVVDVLLDPSGPGAGLRHEARLALSSAFGGDSARWLESLGQLPGSVDCLEQPIPAGEEPRRRQLGVSYLPLWSDAGRLERIVFCVTETPAPG